ncbi:hypothetical protein [Chromatium okenii]|nr:hypothetical protein [Chromatium okenii]
MDNLFSIIIIATSIWVLIDAKKIGVKRGQISGMGNMGPWGWFFVCFFLWIIGLFFYLAKRPEFKRINTEARIVLKRKSKLSAIYWIGTVFFALFFMYFSYLMYQENTDDFSNLVRINPVPQAQQLVQQEKIVEADDYLSYFMDYQYVNQDLQVCSIVQ